MGQVNQAWHGWQAGEVIIAQRGDGFQRDITGTLNGPPLHPR
jgi:hypothetical protein